MKKNEEFRNNTNEERLIELEQMMANYCKNSASVEIQLWILLLMNWETFLQGQPQKLLELIS